MKKIIVVIPHSHTWLWTQTCAAALRRTPPKADDCEVQIILVDNSWEWSPSIRGIADTVLGEWICIRNNSKANKFHASALDDIVDNFEFDYLMALETDVLVLRHNWLQSFVNAIGDSHFVAGHWHHEQFINPSCTIYRGSVLREMNAWCKANTSSELRWGSNFEQVQEVPPEYVSWIAGPFSEKRGFPKGWQSAERPTGQEKGPGWYEPGQQLYHWAKDMGYTNATIPVQHVEVDGSPVHTLYGRRQEDLPYRIFEMKDLWGLGDAVHLWAGTRALDIIKHPVNDEFTRTHCEKWIAREARIWRDVVPKDIQKQTVSLIRKHGWHTKSINLGPVDDRDREAARSVEAIYRKAGILI